MSSRSYTSISYGPRTSSSSVSSRGSAGYENYRVPVSESSSRYGSGSDRVSSVTRNGVQVINHKQRMSDPAEPRSSDASRYYGGSSYKR
ncbi:hypothetical protein V500_06584 [Pseudogymnoascus sp. VKM F-4518 (FW-2643)]|nr:hypothetical protein V500_06584 [Pseudogymnoascus sp. VKM F-4518 (FW-2643)]